MTVLASRLRHASWCRPFTSRWLFVIARFVVAASFLTVALGSCAADYPVEKTVPVANKTPKVAVALVDLHGEYQEYLERGGDRPFRSAQRDITVIEDRVLIDATAAADAGQLSLDLASLGCVRLTAAQSIVSCQLPIRAIPELTKLQSLAFARPSRAMTRSSLPVSR